MTEDQKDQKDQNSPNLGRYQPGYRVDPNDVKFVGIGVYSDNLDGPDDGSTVWQLYNNDDYSKYFIQYRLKNLVTHDVLFVHKDFHVVMEYAARKGCAQQAIGMDYYTVVYPYCIEKQRLYQSEIEKPR